jgi:hypothetical protein
MFVALLLANKKERGNAFWVTCCIAAETHRMKICRKDDGCLEVRCDSKDGIRIGLLTQHTLHCNILLTSSAIRDKLRGAHAFLSS